tara:strand:- start:11107 stop:11568 length:462 start_codon:yes stop_codon:yes gene_type:complete
MGKGQKKGGKKHKRNKNRDIETTTIRFKEDGQEYAQITKCKGNCRFDVKCSDGKDRAAILCGTMRKRKFVNLNDIVLVSLRDFQDDLCDIMDSYDENGARKLRELKELPETFTLGEDNDFQDGMDSIEFTTELPSDNSDEGYSMDDDINLEEI